MSRDAKKRLEGLNLIVLGAMAALNPESGKETPKQKLPSWWKSPAPSTSNQYVTRSSSTTNRTETEPEPPYLTLNFSSRQIRLFRLQPSAEVTGIEGSFHYVDLSTVPEYTALSYAWGDQTNCRQITIDGTKVEIRENPWSFLQLQKSAISQPKLFWVDAVCINQSNIHERNHQVGLIKHIYANVSEVYVWLGQNLSNSDLAMDYISKNGTRELKARGPRFRRLWTDKEGKRFVSYSSGHIGDECGLSGKLFTLRRLRFGAGRRVSYGEPLRASISNSSRLKIKVGSFTIGMFWTYSRALHA